MQDEWGWSVRGSEKVPGRSNVRARREFWIMLDQNPALGSVLHPSVFQWTLKVEHRILRLYSKKKKYPLFQSEGSLGSSALWVSILSAPIFLQRSAWYEWTSKACLCGCSPFLTSLIPNLASLLHLPWSYRTLAGWPLGPMLQDPTTQPSLGPLLLTPTQSLFLTSQAQGPLLSLPNL